TAATVAATTNPRDRIGPHTTPKGRRSPGLPLARARDADDDVVEIATPAGGGAAGLGSEGDVDGRIGVEVTRDRCIGSSGDRHLDLLARHSDLHLDAGPEVRLQAAVHLVRV